jgi:glycerol uptake facilitator-like aquaporin
VSQFIGGLLGALLASAVLSSWVAHPSVNHVVTMPDRAGVFAAFTAEIIITFILMTVILHVSNNSRLHKWTGLCAGALLLIYITLRSAGLRHEHEPSANFSFRGPGASLGGSLDLFHGADYWYALGR